MLTAEDSTAEAAFEEGRIVTEAGSEPVHELEQRDGAMASLDRLVLKLLEQSPALIDVERKAARGRRLGAGVAPPTAKAARLAVAPEASGLDGFRTVMTSRLGELLANQPAAVGVPEGIHQTRVVIRRLRTALDLFEPHLEPRAAARFAAELRRIGQVLGGTREWDVFCLETLPKALCDGPGAAWEPALREAAAAAPGKAGRGVGQEFGQPALTSLALGLAAWQEDARAAPALVGDDRLQRPLSKIASPLLERWPARWPSAAGTSGDASPRSCMP